MKTFETKNKIKNVDEKFVRDLWLQPHVKRMYDNFEEITRGNRQAPKQPILGNPDYLSQHRELKSYHDLLKRNMATFAQHTCTSIPFMLEKRCRMGLTLCRYAQAKKDTKNHFTFYELSSPDGAEARTMAEYSDGVIQTLTDGPVRDCEEAFYKFLRHNYSKFNFGPYVDTTPELLATTPNFIQFKNGFDVIHTNMMFQFVSPEREKQIGYVFRLLKKDGLMVFTEKLNQSDPDEYERREIIKDKLFKSKYYSDEEIQYKKTSILNDMSKGQVDQETLIKAIKKYFKYIVLTWNSTNFYEFVTSNNENTIQLYLSQLIPPYIPEPFCFEKEIPRQIWP
ncbi:hypothetical protein MHK_002894 [Candidatus Magnetomorum sp. HK-1]|nr:hypothetical protein MHK_002894 [Candidatus Magnetomorum sp. HK-1]